MQNNLASDLHLSTLGDLVSKHGVDPALFHPGALHLVPADEYLDGLERWGEERNLKTTHGQLETRARTWEMVRKAQEAAGGGWSLFSVRVNQQGWPSPGLAFLGHRIHPCKRTPSGLRFDTRGWDPVNRGLMLPPFSFSAAIELLQDYDFSCEPDTYEPWQAWRFILEHPEIPIWVEESALKALAACSIGQLAVGVNGINGWGQKGRSDRLHPFLKRLARKGRRVIVRFDRPESAKSQSDIQARKLTRRLEREGAEGGGWWCWLPHLPAKTDDFVAALIRGTITCDERKWLHYFVNNCSRSSDYKRLKQFQPHLEIAREFTPADVLEAARTHHVVVLWGATGTAKTKAFVGALELLEAEVGQKFVVLGIYHRASLVHKGAYEFGVVNMSAPPGSAERQGLYEGQIMRDGLFCCGESAYKETADMTLWRWYWELKENPRPTLLYMDEISQVLANWVVGGTDALRKIRHKALQALEGLLSLPCVRVWAADALLGDIELEWLARTTKTQPALLHSTFTRQRDLYLALPTPSTERALQLQLKAVAQRGGRFCLGHGTKAGLHRLMDALPTAADGGEMRVTGDEDSRNDPRVARLMADPETEWPKYPHFGFTSAISSGLSMAATSMDLTAIVQEFHWQAEDVVQALNRARVSQTRILLAPKVVPHAAGITKEMCPERASQALQERMQSGALDDYTALLSERHPATRRAVAQLEARRNLECFHNDWCLRSFLEQEGYRIRNLAELENGQAPDQPRTKAAVTETSRTLDSLQAYRLAALQRLASGSSTLQSEQHEAMRLTEGGTFLDLTEADVSEAWKVAQEIGLDGLISAGTVHSGSPEVQAVWANLAALNKAGAQRLGRALGCRADRIPGPMDPHDIRKLWPLVKAIGFCRIKAGETRATGKRWRLEPIDLG